MLIWVVTACWSASELLKTLQRKRKVPIETKFSTFSPRSRATSIKRKSCQWKQQFRKKCIFARVGIITYVNKRSIWRHNSIECFSASNLKAWTRKVKKHQFSKKNCFLWRNLFRTTQRTSKWQSLEFAIQYNRQKRQREGARRYQ